MHVELHSRWQSATGPQAQVNAAARHAKDLISRCVHCGFCTATCPTYQLLGDEQDGPRGRIWLIKQMLESGAATRITQQHLDRCLSCRNCETTCPSGVEYGRLIDIGREVSEKITVRPWHEKLARWLLRRGLLSAFFPAALWIGRVVRPALPSVLQKKIPATVGREFPVAHFDAAFNAAGHAAQKAEMPRIRPEHQVNNDQTTQTVVILHAGCVQKNIAPEIHQATRLVLEFAHIRCEVATDAGCCGALDLHLGDTERADIRVRNNLAAWEPLMAKGTVQAIISDASGCGVLLKDYGHHLQTDAEWSARARLVGSMIRDVSELLVGDVLLHLKKHMNANLPKLAWHAPCTLQHGQKLGSNVVDILRTLGFDVALPKKDAHMCCGAAGTYSVLQPKIAAALLAKKLANFDLNAADGRVLVSANMGCITHLQQGTQAPVRHWIEIVAQCLLPRQNAEYGLNKR